MQACRFTGHTCKPPVAFLSCMQVCNHPCTCISPVVSCHVCKRAGSLVTHASHQWLFCHVCKCAIILAHAYHQWCPVMYASVQVHWSHMQATSGLSVMYASVQSSLHMHITSGVLSCMQACRFTGHTCKPPVAFLSCMQ